MLERVVAVMVAVIRAVRNAGAGAVVSGVAGGHILCVGISQVAIPSPGALVIGPEDTGV